MQKQRWFWVTASMGDQCLETEFLTYPQWAERTARALVERWMFTRLDIATVEWTYHPQFDPQSRVWVR